MQRGQIFQAGQALVEVLADAPGSLAVDGAPMNLLVENTHDGAKEKHVPVVEKIEGGYKVTVGSVPHPMEEKHYIVLIELATERQVLRHYLKPGEAPEAVFRTNETAVSVREFCNIHGLWKA